MINSLFLLLVGLLHYDTRKTFLESIREYKAGPEEDGGKRGIISQLGFLITHDEKKDKGYG